MVCLGKFKNKKKYENAKVKNKIQRHIESHASSSRLFFICIVRTEVEIK